MKKYATVGLAVCLASCAPAMTPRVEPVTYVGNSSEILATIVRVAPTLQLSKYYEPFAVVSATPNAVTLSAKPTMGNRLLVGFIAGVSSSDMLVTFTALPTGDKTIITYNVAGNLRNSNSDALPVAKTIYSELDKHFQRAQ